MTEQDFTLRQLRDTQKAFDKDNFSGATTPEGKRRHILFHLQILVAKLARVEEGIDLGEDNREAVCSEIIPDLLTYAAQLAELEDVGLTELYTARLGSVAERNGTGAESAQRAIEIGTQEIQC